jgi:hypothetical protein
MKCGPFLKCGLIWLCSVSAHTLVAKVSPVQKVIQMMDKMKATSEDLMDAEQKTFAEYTEWVDDRQTELGFEIKTGKAEIEKLTAFIEEADIEVAKLGKKIKSTDGEIDRMEKEMKEATDLRKKENTEYMTTQQDLAESVEAIEKATQVVTEGAQDKKQASSLLQGLATTMPKMDAVLAAFLEEQDQQLGAPAADAYQSQSDGILGMLKGLEAKFKKELDECMAVESNKAHAYQLEMQHLTDTVKATEIELSEKKAHKGKTMSDSAKAKGELSKTKAELTADEKMLVEVTATFRTKKSMFETNQKTRKDELGAITKAIELICSPQVAESYSENMKFAQVSLLQTQSSSRRVAARHRVSRFLEQRAQLLSSTTLHTFATEVAASPFAKVVGLIKGLIAKLKEEAAAEAKHNEFCEKELKANKLTRQKEGSKADKLEAQIEGLESDIDSKAKAISTITAELAALSKAMTKATDIRTEEKKRNADTIKDATVGAEATKRALTLLRKFYSSQAFIQQEPDMDKYSGQQGSSKGVIGMLEVIESDFLKLKAETSADEATLIPDGFTTLITSEASSCILASAGVCGVFLS